MLRPGPGDVCLDATFGYGGHTQAILPLIRPGGPLDLRLNPQRGEPVSEPLKTMPEAALAKALAVRSAKPAV